MEPAVGGVEKKIKIIDRFSAEENSGVEGEGKHFYRGSRISTDSWLFYVCVSELDKEFGVQL